MKAAIAMCTPMSFHPSMPRRCVPVFLLCAGLTSLGASAQTLPPLTVSPDKATLLVGDTHTFRAVGNDGRIRHNVRWGISSSQAATITVHGDEVTVLAREPSPSVLLTASAEGDSADASIEIRPAGDLPAGTPLWSVSPAPGCKATKMTQAVPSANGPDLYVQEDCPDGGILRALTADGRELWRRRLGSAPTPASGAAPIAQGPYMGMVPNGASAKPPAQPARPTVGPTGEPMRPHASSVCDAIPVGLTRDQAFKAIAEHQVTLDARQRQSDLWTIEEEGFRCTISFDGKTGNVVKKNKTIVSD